VQQTAGHFRGEKVIVGARGFGAKKLKVVVAQWRNCESATEHGFDRFRNDCRIITDQHTPRERVHSSLDDTRFCLQYHLDCGGQSGTVFQPLYVPSLSSLNSRTESYRPLRNRWSWCQYGGSARVRVGGEQWRH
jgi:hypothetical protein